MKNSAIHKIKREPEPPPKPVPPKFVPLETGLVVLKDQKNKKDEIGDSDESDSI